MRGLTVSQLRLYNEGYDARCQGHGRDAGYLLHQATRQPWLMGWHQADHDNGIRIYNGPERPRRQL